MEESIAPAWRYESFSKTALILVNSLSFIAFCGFTTLAVLHSSITIFLHAM